jgi:hypothetical protein
MWQRLIHLTKPYTSEMNALKFRTDFAIALIMCYLLLRNKSEYKRYYHGTKGIRPMYLMTCIAPVPWSNALYVSHNQAIQFVTDTHNFLPDYLHD